MLDSYILKKEGRRKVLVLSAPEEGAQRAQTRYKTLRVRDNLSLVECELLTGRTHQIRAQFADKGHPLLGDGQYGDYREGERFGREFQALYAYKLVFTFKSDAGVLNYLRDKIFEVWDVPFVEQFFPWEE
jgi:23S rRNA pseudouridine955/2504/2580 synthase